MLEIISRNFVPFFPAYCLQIIDVCWCSFSDLNFQELPQCSNMIQIQGLTWPLQNINNIFRQPILPRFSCILGIIFLLENIIRRWLKTLNRRHQIFLQDLFILLGIHLTVYYWYFAHTFHRKTSPNYHVANEKFDSWYRFLWWVGFAIVPPHMISIIMIKQLNFCSMCP